MDVNSSIRSMKKFFKSLLSEKGEVSSIRFLTVIATVIILSLYVIKNCLSKDFTDIPINSFYLLGSLLGVKLGSKFFEVASSMKKDSE